MASTPFFFFFSGLLFLAWFTADVHSVKVHEVLKGSTAVLSPDDAETSITSITWKNGPDLAAEWFGDNQTFYNIFKDTCSLNTKTGELTINNVRPEHGGKYTPDINGKTRSAIKLRVLSPVPKPSITLHCYPEKTLTCSLTCWFDRTDDLGDVEVFWILDDSHERGGRKIQITKDTKEKKFICNLKNSVSSENSTELQNPLLFPRESRGTDDDVWITVARTAVSFVLLALLVVVFWRWISPKYRRYRIFKEIRETMTDTEHERISAEICGAGPVKAVHLTLLKVDKMTLKILEEGSKRKLSDESVLMFLTLHYLILSLLKQGPQTHKSLKKVEEMIEKFFKGRNIQNLNKDEEQKLNDVHWIIGQILEEGNKLKLDKDEEQKLKKIDDRISRILSKRKEKGAVRDSAAGGDVDQPVFHIPPIREEQEGRLTGSEEEVLLIGASIVETKKERKTADVEENSGN